MESKNEIFFSNAAVALTQEQIVEVKSFIEAGLEKYSNLHNVNCVSQVNDGKSFIKLTDLDRPKV